ncbi:hypothetical protein Btru_022503 [Bulinus truncatus]|nr:hypothetical protein Btru_022503 [Bulinus truncatus]
MEISVDLPEIQVEDENNVLTKYTDPIDLSNACREFYQSRLEMTKAMKTQWTSPTTISGDGHQPVDNRKHVNNKVSLDAAIQVLKHEMASLMEQDLHLMKQMLTLNEEIEDLKWRKRHAWGEMSSSFYSSDMIQSNISVGRADEQVPLKFSPPSSLSLQLEGISNRFSVYNDDDPCGTFNRKTFPSKTYLANKKFHNRLSLAAQNVPITNGVTIGSSKRMSLNEFDYKTNHLSDSSERINSDYSSKYSSRPKCMTTSGDRCRLMDNGELDCVIEETGIKIRSTVSGMSGQKLQQAMVSQDSGIHDCNNGSL